MASSRPRDRRPARPPLEAHVQRDVLWGGAPALVVALVLLVHDGYDAKTQWTFGLAIVAVWLAFSFVARARVLVPLQTIGNQLASLREGDFSLRARRATGSDALAAALAELNGLSASLREQRAGAMEAAALLDRVMSEIDVAIFAFDDQNRLVLLNRAGERLLGPRDGRWIGLEARELGLDALLAAPAPRTLDATFPGGASRWEVRRAAFRQHGLPHELLVVSDLSRALREEERAAWQRLVRVLGHEINNSLAPIQSITGQLRRALEQGTARGAEWEADAIEGLAAVGGRAESLGRFLNGYARLTRLPKPRPTPMDAEAWIRRVVRLEDRVAVRVEAGPPTGLSADPDLLDQLLINVVRNAAEAAAETRGGVEVRWSRRGRVFEVEVLDEGVGVAGSENLFVPFFTTKPTGSGIGLVLARQIAEAHGGTLTLDRRAAARGSVARLRLPLGGEALAAEERPPPRAGSR